MLVEVARKAYLASIVPVIVNAILNEHQIVVDIVAFVNKGDFPRSRLGEKQRGKILAGWVSRKMRTMAQFAIRDMDREAMGPAGTSSGDQSTTHGGHDASGEYHRSSLGSLRSSSGGPPPMHGTSSSLRNVEPAPQMPEQRHHSFHHHHEHPHNDHHYDNNHHDQHHYDHHHHHHYSHQSPPPGPVEMPADSVANNDQAVIRDYARSSQSGGLAQPHAYELPDFDRFGRDGAHDNGARPGVPGGEGNGSGGVASQPPQIRLPGVDGRESFGDWDLNLRAGDGTGNGSRSHPVAGQGQGQGQGDEEWVRDAYVSMNLAGTLGGGR